MSVSITYFPSLMPSTFIDMMIFQLLFTSTLRTKSYKKSIFAPILCVHSQSRFMQQNWFSGNSCCCCFFFLYFQMCFCNVFFPQPIGFCKNNHTTTRRCIISLLLEINLTNQRNFCREKHTRYCTECTRLGLFCYISIDVSDLIPLSFRSFFFG